ncbi:tRNA pseudouridine(13) synthase TruD [Candidatus Woesearchaeota archaeon]|nr:MAG: tRNA pseudouridine(13) synthase TruD [Candidatus Woesearchaeota archaeon]
MILKYSPEDFVVEEINNIKLSSKGKYCYFNLTKKNWTTSRAILKLAKKLNVSPKRFNVSGMKDKEGITTQLVSVYNLKKEDLKVRIKDIKIDFVGYNDKPLKLNSHIGNKFIITARELIKPLAKINHFCNYYDDQRFGGKRPNTALVGKLLLERKFEEAMKIYLTNPFETETEKHKNFRQEIEKNWGYFDSSIIPSYLIEKKVITYLEKHPKDYFKAFQQLPKQILTLFIHSYQSLLFNKILNNYVKDNFEHYFIDTVIGKLAMTNEFINLKIPLIGYDFVENNKNLKPIISDILAKENIEPKMFKQSYRTTYRPASITLKDLTLYPAEKDNVFPEKLKQKVSFSLPSGSYATMVLKAMEK